MMRMHPSSNDPLTNGRNEQGSQCVAVVLFRRASKQVRAHPTLAGSRPTHPGLSAVVSIAVPVCMRTCASKPNNFTVMYLKRTKQPINSKCQNTNDTLETSKYSSRQAHAWSLRGCRLTDVSEERGVRGLLGVAVAVESLALASVRSGATASRLISMALQGVFKGECEKSTRMKIVSTFVSEVLSVRVYIVKCVLYLCICTAVDLGY